MRFVTSLWSLFRPAGPVAAPVPNPVMPVEVRPPAPAAFTHRVVSMGVDGRRRVNGPYASELDAWRARRVLVSLGRRDVVVEPYDPLAEFFEGFFDPERDARIV